MKLLLMTLLFVAAYSFAQNPTISQLVGTWRLVSIEDTTKDRKTGPSAQFGPHATGFLMYEPDGHMCAAIMNPDRPVAKDQANPTDAEKAAYYDSFVAYCGTYKLDSAKSIVTHYPSVAWWPQYVGSTQARPFKLDGNHLIITVTEGMEDIGVQKRVLVWERAK